jgi:threonine dehydrogenase-like Zn-dependent dehydrogenase
MKMKAAVYYGPGDIRIEEVERPRAENGVDGLGVVCKVKACAVCDIMDLPAYTKGIAITDPGVAMGHEWSGEVVEVGPNVTFVKEGDRIFGFAFRPCLECPPCKARDYGGCNNYREGGAGHKFHGAFAEYNFFPFGTAGNIVKVPDELSYRDGALIEPFRLSVGLGQKVEADDIVVIFGMKFLAAGALARIKATGLARKIIVVDTSKKRLEIAKKLGADVVIDELNEDVVKRVMEESDNKGAQVVYETNGKPENFQQAREVVAEGNVKTTPIDKGGTIWLPQPYDEDVCFNGSLLKGGSAIRHPWGTIEGFTLYKETVEHMKAGEVPADLLVTDVFPLEETRQAFETALHSPDTIKVIVEP